MRAMQDKKNYPILEINDRFSWDIINFKSQKTDISKVINLLNKIVLIKTFSTDKPTKSPY